MKNNASVAEMVLAPGSYPGDAGSSPAGGTQYNNVGLSSNGKDRWLLPSRSGFDSLWTHQAEVTLLERVPCLSHRASRVRFPSSVPAFDTAGALMSYQISEENPPDPRDWKGLISEKQYAAARPNPCGRDVMVASLPSKQIVRVQVSSSVPSRFSSVEELLPYKQAVGGSNPSTGTLRFSSDRLDNKSKGRKKLLPQLRFYSSMVEPWLCNPVIGVRFVLEAPCPCSSVDRAEAF